MAEHADEIAKPRWLAPRDGGRGREVRGRWSVLRFFSWRYGTFYRRGRRWYTPLTWHFLPTRTVLLGVTAYRDDDDCWNVEAGLGLLHLHVLLADWPRPPKVSGSPASQEADRG